MGRTGSGWLLRCVLTAWLSVCGMLQACSAVSPDEGAEPPTLAPAPTSRIDAAATVWPTWTPFATRTPLPTPTPRPAAPNDEDAVPVLTRGELANSAYPVSAARGGVAQLADGLYVEPAGARAPTLSVVLADVVSFGDLNRDRRDDAAVLLVVREVGAVPEQQVHVVLDQVEGRAIAVSLSLDELAVVRSMVIATNRLTLELLTLGDGDAPCCPQTDSRRIYELVDGELTKLTQWDGPLQRSVVPTVPEVQPLPFAPGTSASLIRGRLEPLGDQRFGLSGQEGQQLDLGVTSPHEQVAISVRGLEDGVVLAGVASVVQRAAMTLPSLQDYEVTLVSTSGSATSYALAVSLEPLLQVSPTPMLAPPTASLTATATATETTRSAATPTPSPITPTVGTEPAISGTPLTATVIITPTASPSGAVLPSVPAGSEAYLTFDAASQAPGWGAAIAEALADLGVTGTFFIGDWGSDDATALLAGGQQLGYLDVAARTPDRIGREAMLQDVREALASPGVAPCVRPSYGAMDALSRAALAEAGLQVVLWDVVLDPSGPGPEVVDEGDGMTDAVVAAADRLLAQVYPGATVRVVVDGNADHVAGVLRRALPQLTGMGFDLVASCRDAATE